MIIDGLSDMPESDLLLLISFINPMKEGKACVHNGLTPLNTPLIGQTIPKTRKRGTANHRTPSILSCVIGVTKTGRNRKPSR